MKRGFTLIELMIVITILTLIITFSFTSFIEYKDVQISRTVTADITSLIRETKQKTISAETSNQFGIHFSTSSLTTFEGSTYSPTGLSNVVYPFYNTNLDINLSDGSEQIIFSRLTGEVSATGTIAIGHIRLNSTTTLTVLESGLIE